MMHACGKASPLVSSPPTDTPPVGLYFHIPFCNGKCPYCDFYSIRPSDETLDGYLSTLLSEMTWYPNVTADTIYLGGGTPPLLGAERLETLLREAQCRFSVPDTAEITIEANPGSVTPPLLSRLRKAGANRLSFGVQSGVESELQALGRRHSVLDTQTAVQMAREAGFANLSADLMLGIPGQTPASLARSIDFLCSLEVTHISAYLLKIESGTPFDREGILTRCPDEDAAAALYLQAVEQLAAHGYRQYEISNFARPGFESRHNLKYWNCDAYIGFGPAAHSYFGGRRFSHGRDLAAYIASDGMEQTVTDDHPGSFEEYAMLRLRLADGLVLDGLKDRFDVDPEPLLRRAQPYAKAGLLTADRHHIALTPSGFLLSNALIAKLVL